MKILRNLFLMLMCVVPMTALAQTENPVKWSHTVTEKGNGLYTVQFKAEMEDAMAMCGVHSLSEISRDNLY